MKELSMAVTKVLNKVNLEAITEGVEFINLIRKLNKRSAYITDDVAREQFGEIYKEYIADTKFENHDSIPFHIVLDKIEQDATMRRSINRINNSGISIDSVEFVGNYIVLKTSLTSKLLSSINTIYKELRSRVQSNNYGSFKYDIRALSPKINDAILTIVMKEIKEKHSECTFESNVLLTVTIIKWKPTFPDYSNMKKEDTSILDLLSTPDLTIKGI